MAQVSIIGIGAASVNYAEYLSLNVLNSYSDGISGLQNIFKKNTNIQATDYDKIICNIRILNDLAKKGATDTNGTTTYQSYMNEPMADTLNDIMRSLAIVNVPPAANTPPLTDAEKIETVQSWQNLSQFGIFVNDYFTTAAAIKSNATSFSVPAVDQKTGLPIKGGLLVQAFPSRSLQSALELEYVSYGNQLISSQLTNLQGALTTSQQVLGTLTSLQDYMNQITVGPKTPPFSFPPNATEYSSASIYSMIDNNQNGVVGIVLNGIQGNVTNNLATVFNQINDNTSDPLNELIQQFIFVNNIFGYTVPIPLTADSQINGGLGSFSLSLFYALVSQGDSRLASAALADYHSNSSNLTIAGQINFIANGLTDPKTFKAQYEIAASAYFKQLTPTVALTQQITDAATNLISLKNDLLQEVKSLVAQNPSAGVAVLGSLAQACFQVASSISTVFKNVDMSLTGPALQAELLSSVKTYIMDGQDQTLTTSATTAQSSNQNKITNAITAASTLEETQREAVKRYIFIFQQFYKTTAAMLKTLETILEKITKGFQAS